MASSFDIKSYPGNIINGQFVPTTSTRHSIDPATAEPLWEVPIATKEDLDNAIKHARGAFKSWSKSTFEERGELVLKHADAIEKNPDDLEKLLTTEQGKPLAFSIWKSP
ncbi:Fc.00g070410.m01.CDS01 [Cosmosporella sp. VM-42]